MSHLKERKEKNCLNCNAAIMGRYCHICGQENIEPKESAWHLVSHFFQDITHFDGKFFSTLKLLTWRPGFLSRQYMMGRRASYLNPVRMYVFASAIFFLIFFSVFHGLHYNINSNIGINKKTLAEVNEMDSLSFNKYTANINKNDHKDAVPMTRAMYKRYYDSTLENNGLQINGRSYKSKKEYDSLLAHGIVKHGWIKRKLVNKLIEINTTYHSNIKEIIAGLSNNLLHSFPQMLFISLPLLALILKLLYRRQKQFYYVSHAIFGIHLYIFVFIGLLILLGTLKLQDHLHWAVFDYLIFFIYLGLFFYEYKAIRNFYQQRRAKSIIKFLLLNLLFFFVMNLLFIIFIFLSLFKL